MHRDLGRELEPWTAEQEALDLWREEFNHERPHEALGMKCPAEIYQRSTRVYGGAGQDIAYPGKYSRRVDKHGKVDWQGAEIAISGSLRGWSVGLSPLANGKVEVWFGRLLLGWIDRSTESFQGAASRPLEAGQPQSQHVM